MLVIPWSLKKCFYSPFRMACFGGPLHGGGRDHCLLKLLQFVYIAHKHSQFLETNHLFMMLDEDDEEVQEAEYYASKSSKKKEMKRQEREARRQAEEGAHEVQRMKQDRYAEMRHRKDEEREAEERRKEEEAQAQKAKEEEATNAEFERWKDAFSVDTEGTAEEEMQRGGQGLLFDFVEYIKKHKCVLLEDLSAEFKLRTQDCINRIFALEKMGRLYGVMDDRGKYIYISLEEMKVVADYIKRQGRVSIAHLASKSNEFIALEPELDLDKVPMKLNEDYNVNSESNAITVT
ncbi:hypothetical protein SUGI_0832870 [Cryptomeria japonica]|nr:hypothetical protein SUGI_0832870 [Cryptomeria japonica]